MQFTPSFVKKISSSELVKRLRQDKVLILDNSEFSQWSNCFVKGLYYGGLKRINSHGQAALTFGRAVHEGLAARLSGSTKETAIKKAVEAAEEEHLNDMLDPARNTDRLVSLLVSYFIHCDASGDWIRPVVVDGKPLVEQSFCYELGKVMVEDVQYKVFWKGKIDVIARTDGDLWGYDHKTTSVMGEKFMDDKIRGNQFPGYTWAGNIMAASYGEEMKGIITNALAMRKTGFEFKQFKLPYSKLVLDEWVDETLEACGELIWKIIMMFERDQPHVPTFNIAANREACVTKYGRCSYFDVCEMAAPMREKVLFDESFFKHNDWDCMD